MQARVRKAGSARSPAVLNQQRRLVIAMPTRTPKITQVNARLTRVVSGSLLSEFQNILSESANQPEHSCIHLLQPPTPSVPTSSHTAGNLWSVQSILKQLKQSTPWDESTVERVYEADVFPAVRFARHHTVWEFIIRVLPTYGKDHALAELTQGEIP